MTLGTTEKVSCVTFPEVLFVFFLFFLFFFCFFKGANVPMRDMSFLGVKTNDFLMETV